MNCVFGLIVSYSLLMYVFIVELPFCIIIVLHIHLILCPQASKYINQSKYTHAKGNIDRKIKGCGTQKQSSQVAKNNTRTHIAVCRISFLYLFLSLFPIAPL
jgi:hypothetical protein